MSYDNAPEYLKQFDHWLLWRKDKTPVNCNNIPIDPTDPANLVSFNCAVECAHHFAGIGYSFQPIDGCTGIDLDDAYKTKPDGSYAYADPAKEQARQKLIYETFDSYSELSPSGKGVHIIVKGEINGGAKPSWTPVEIYDRQRFFTVTGNVIDERTAIKEVDAVALTTLYEQLKPAVRNVTTVGIDREATQSDDDIIRLATEYNDKFAPLMAGNLLHHSSASEACVHLMNIIGSFTQNREQCRRLFALSPLGSRDKVAKRPGLVEDWIDMSFDKLPPPIDFSAMAAAWQSGVSEADGDTTPTPESAVVTSDALDTGLEQFERDFNYDPPPGLIGEVAQWIYDQAPYPVREIALGGALGIMAGICGQAYNVSNTGLNQYVLVLAQTGAGKEAMASGITKLMGEVALTVPTASEFIGPGQIASGQALVAYMGENKGSILSIMGEFGLRLQQMSGARASTNDIGIRATLLDLYNKSGAGNWYQVTVYRKKEERIPAIWAPNFSMLGESTPERFYEALSEDMIYEGFVPRMTIIDYKGKRTPYNITHASATLDARLIEAIASLCAYCKTSMGLKTPTVVAFDTNGNDLQITFREYCSAKLNADNADEILRQLWTRAHVKAMKLAALRAVGINRTNPIITYNDMKWAIGFVLTDINQIIRKFFLGEVGMTALPTDEHKQIEHVVRIIKEWAADPNYWQKYRDSKEMKDAKVILHEILSRRLLTLPAFSKDRLGATGALKRAIQTLIDWGYIAEVGQSTLQDKFGHKRKAYALIDPLRFR